MKKVIVLALLVLLGCSGPKDTEDRFIRVSSQWNSGHPIIVVCDRETKSEYALVPRGAFQPLGTSCKDAQ